MLFSSMFFLWVFLPVVLIVYWLLPGIPLKNALLLLASILFYSWGEPLYVLLLIAVVAVDYIAALLIERLGKSVIIIAVIVNLAILGVFKYYNFAAGIVNGIFSGEIIPLRDIALPLGISFYTFQSMSYVIDVYRKKTGCQKNFFKVLMYVSLFPQLVAGPIVRYQDVEREIDNRQVTIAQVAYGAKRFAYGLGKKVLVSNVLAIYADSIMDGDISVFSSGALWLGSILYTLQIYFDFSGYSDMAIGLGRMFGFHFRENFDYPYVSTSIREFWRRWHISLSTWFREYLYIPLGGNRKGNLRTCINLMIVFAFTGLWHGASFGFVFWGIFHGFFVVMERIFLGKILDKNPLKIINHIYTLVVVSVGLVFFRQVHFSMGLSYVAKMFSFQGGEYGFLDIISGKLILILIVAILLLGFVQERIPGLKGLIYREENVTAFEIVLVMGILFLSFMMLTGSAYNPFIYFRF